MLDVNKLKEFYDNNPDDCWYYLDSSEKDPEKWTLTYKNNGTVINADYYCRYVNRKRTNELIEKALKDNYEFYNSVYLPINEKFEEAKKKYFDSYPRRAGYDEARIEYETWGKARQICVNVAMESLRNKRIKNDNCCN